MPLPGRPGTQGDLAHEGTITPVTGHAGEPSRGGTIMRRKHQAGEPSHGRADPRGHLAHGGIILRGDLLHREHTREAESTRGRETNVAEPQKPRGDYVQKKREVDDVAVWLGGPRNFPANSQDHQQEAQAILVGRRPGGRGCSVCSGARGRCGTRAAPWCGADAARVAGRGRARRQVDDRHVHCPPGEDTAVRHHTAHHHRLATRPGEVPAPQGVLGPRGESRPGLRPSLTWALQLAL